MKDNRFFCRSCGEYKPREEFDTHPSGKRAQTCRECLEADTIPDTLPPSRRCARCGAPTNDYRCLNCRLELGLVPRPDRPNTRPDFTGVALPWGTAEVTV